MRITVLNELTNNESEPLNADQVVEKIISGKLNRRSIVRPITNGKTAYVRLGNLAPSLFQKADILANDRKEAKKQSAVDRKEAKKQDRELRRLERENSKAARKTQESPENFIAWCSLFVVLIRSAGWCCIGLLAISFSIACYRFGFVDSANSLYWFVAIGVAAYLASELSALTIRFFRQVVTLLNS